MATSSTNSWLNSSLLSPTSQQQSPPHHALYQSDVQLQSANHVQQQQTMNLGQETHGSCTAFCQPHTCPLNLDFHQSGDSHQLQDFSKPAGGSCSGGHAGGKGGECGGHVSARKVHKADREKLRRDRLNEQFAELAGVLDPDRPKNDKATILGDSVQVVKELRTEVKRLRTEQTALVDESRDLAQEKTELREEKSALKTETEQLQAQLQQRLRLMLPWISMDPSMMMPPYGYPMPVSQPVSAPPPPTSESHQQPGVQQTMPQQQHPQHPQPVSAGAPYMPLPSHAPSAYPLHPALQAYSMYANRPGDATAPYLPYPHYPTQVNSPHPQVERPYPQYASQMQPYLMQMQAHQVAPTPNAAPHAPPMYQPFAPHSMPLMPPRTEVAPLSNSQPARAPSRHPDSAYGPHGPPVLQPSLEPPGSVTAVQTTLQLQTPVHPEPQRPSQQDKADESSKADTGGAGPPTSGVQKESEPGTQDTTQAPGVGNSTDLPLLTTTPTTTTSAAPPNEGPPSTTQSGGEAEAQGGKDGDAAGQLQQKDASETHDPTLRPPAA